MVGWASGYLQTSAACQPVFLRRRFRLALFAQRFGCGKHFRVAGICPVRGFFLATEWRMIDGDYSDEKSSMFFSCRGCLALRPGRAIGLGYGNSASCILPPKLLLYGFDIPPCRSPAFEKLNVPELATCSRGLSESVSCISHVHRHESLHPLFLVPGDHSWNILSWSGPGRDSMRNRPGQTCSSGC